MRVVDFAEVAEDLQTVLDGVVAGRQGVIIRGETGAEVVLLSMEQFNGLMETLHLVKSPANAGHLARSQAQLGSRIHERFKPLGGLDINKLGGDEKKD
ncbi:antitoxin YefM [Pseudomonas nitritireducens]|uniref:Antitoxin n=1 Tax=Pseudomonas nitroreducens TaxID=46680 RepID=A0A7W7KTC7_PSENT|nr:type II toxin-antitoxin system Phd/YefM family antitoxin [Pseudomonas nitritireducens]MBB4868108.1 antitoxin YefM [Pseudomonas nitritireducens]